MGEVPTITPRELRHFVESTAALRLLQGRTTSILGNGFDPENFASLDIEVRRQLVSQSSDPQPQAKAPAEHNFPLFFWSEVPMKMETSSLNLFEKP